MAMFLGHIAFLLATFAVAIGLSLLQLGQKTKNYSHWVAGFLPL